MKRKEIIFATIAAALVGVGAGELEQAHEQFVRDLQGSPNYVESFTLTIPTERDRD